MLNFTDWASISGPTVTIGLYMAKVMHDSRVQRDRQHEENRSSLERLRDEFGNRLTAVEVALEHVVFPSWRPHNQRHDDER